MNFQLVYSYDDDWDDDELDMTDCSTYGSC